MTIDVNVNYGFWPFQKFYENSLKKLSNHLNKEEISLGLVSPLEAVFSPDPDVCNRELAGKLKKYKNLLPVAVVNPEIKNWKEILERENYKAIKIFPGYHSFSLADPETIDLIGEINKRKIPLMVQMRMEDERSQYPLLKLKGVEISEIKNLSLKFPQVPVIVLNPYFNEAVELAKNPNVYVDISFVENFDTLAALLEKIPAENVLFGSHTPFLYTRAAIMKLKCSNISKKDYDRIAYKNASEIFDIKSNIKES